MKKTWLLCLPVLVWMGCATASTPERAGEVTFLIGDVRITQGPDSGTSLHRGSAVRAGQQIETSGNGQLHIRFIDGGAVAVRPMTRLRIEDYAYNAEQPTENRIRFFLEQGALRSITGLAGEAAKDRFRINTPVAAIGIRGTDFNVQTTQTLTRASLFRGAIVMAPLGAQCSTSTLGPCAGVAALELGEMQRESHAVQARIQDSVAQLVPKRLEEVRRSSTEVAAWIDAPTSLKQRAENFASETVASARTDQLVGTMPLPRPFDGGDSSHPPGGTGGVDPISPTPPTTLPVVPLPGGGTPGPPLQPIQLQAEANPQLWWGRWAAYADPVNADSQYTRQLRANRERAGGNTVFGLLRTDSSRPQLPLGGGEATFALSGYEVYTVTGTTLTPASIVHAGLSMNFDTRRFATQLDVLPAGAAVLNLSAIGRIESDGRFYSDARQGLNLSGALANRGQQAGYTFERPLNANSFLSGVTAWTR